MSYLAIDVEIEDGGWREHVPDDAKHGLVERIGNLPNGMASGLPATQVLVRLDDGSVVVAEISWRMFHAAARALTARWGAPE